MMLSMDQWDWKTSAPEFVPGGVVQGVLGGFPTSYSDGPQGPFPAHGYGPVAPTLPGGTGSFGSGSYSTATSVHHGTVYRGSSPTEHSQHAASVPQLPLAPLGACAPIVLPEGSSPAAQLRAQYEWQIHSKDQKLRDLQNRLSREEMERMHMQADFERDRQGLMWHLNQLMAAVERYGIPIDEPCEEEARLLCDDPQAAEHTKNRLDSKMEQLNSLLQVREEPIAPRCTAEPRSTAGARGEQRTEARSALAVPGRQSSQASKHRVTFPHDVVHPSADARSLGDTERRTNSTIIDQQARAALQLLGPAGIQEAIRRAEELVQTQGGRCGNLSSALQVVCRKLLRRRGAANSSAAAAAAAAAVATAAAEAVSSGSPTSAVVALLQEELVPPPPPMPPPPPPPPGSSSAISGVSKSLLMTSSDLRRRHSSRPATVEEEDEDDNEADQEDCRSMRRSRLTFNTSGEELPADLQLDPRFDFRYEHRPDPQDELRLGRRAGERGVAARQPNPWSTARFERLSRQGAFELRRSSDSSWDLRLFMSELDPPLTDEGMQVYCRWLHQALQRVREESGLRSLRHVCTEVNFSKSGIGDDAVGRLLQALQRAELCVTSLNFFGNCIGPLGAQHVVEFLRGASFPVPEIHLSHNKIDDGAAIELMSAVAEHPRYPPRRPRDGGSGEVIVPVWLRLNNNWIRDPGRVLRTAAPSALRTTAKVCEWLHLYHFDVQDMPPPQDCLEERGAGRRKEYGVLHHDGPSMDNSLPNGLNLQHGTAAAHCKELLGRRGTAGGLKRGITSSGTTLGPSALCAPPSMSASSRSLLNSTSGSRQHSAGSICAGVPLVAPPRCTSSQDGVIIECGRPADLEEEVQIASCPSSQVTMTPPAACGPPEQTPEPDSELPAARESTSASITTATTAPSPNTTEQIEKQSDATNVDKLVDNDGQGTPPSPSARLPVRLSAPPKILQRGTLPGPVLPHSCS